VNTEDITRSQILEKRQAEGIALVSQLAGRITASLDLKETLDAIVDAVADLVPCSLVEISLWNQRQQKLTLHAIRSTPERAFPVGESYPLGEGFTGWVVQRRKPLFVPDVNTHHDIQPDILPGELPFKAYIGLPLIAADELVGVLVLVHDQAGTFDEDDLQLLEAVAGQATIAIQNARMYQDLARKHEEISALYSVAEAINHPLDLQNIMESALDSVIQVTGAKAAGIRLVDRQSNTLSFVASRGLSPEYVKLIQPISLGSAITGEVASSGKPALIADMLEYPITDPDFKEALIKEGIRARLEVPLSSRELIVGTLGIVSRIPDAFGQKDVDLLTAIGQQLGVAIDNAQLLESTQRKARRLAALHEVASVINQPLSLQNIMGRAIDKVIEVMESDGGGIRLLDKASRELVIVASRGLSSDYICKVECISLGEGIVGRVAKSGEPIVVKNISRDSRSFDMQAAALEGYQSFVVVPLRTKDETVGTLGVIYRRQKEFSLDEMDLLKAIGDQIGVVIENDRLYQAALQAERFASVGRVATSVAHDLRSPLGAILRSAEFLSRPEISPSTREKLISSISSLSRRLINTSQQILDYVQGKQLSLHLASYGLSDFLDEVLSVIQVDLSDQGIEIVKQYHFKGSIVMDSDRMAQVVFNLVSNARDAMPNGGTFTITTQKIDNQIEIHFQDSGLGIASELAERIFDPYFSYGKKQGAGLGLAIARKIVLEHSGTIRVESERRHGAKFIVALPGE
jgi:GAF domain-containing protein